MVACIKMEQVDFFRWTARAKLLLSGLSMTPFTACSAGFLLVQANVISSLVYPTGHVWFGVRMDSGGRGRGKGENLHSLS